MMEVKLWTVVCVLLLTNWGSAKHDDGHGRDSPSSSAAPGAWSSLAPDASTAAAALNRSEPSLSDDVAAGNNSANATTTPSPPASTAPENNQTHLQTTASPKQSSTPRLHLHSTPAGPAQTPGDASPTSAVLPNASATSVGQPDQGTPPVSRPFTPPSPPVPLNTTSGPQTSQSATSSTGSPQGSASSASASTATSASTSTATSASNSSSTSNATTIISPKYTHQPDGHPETSMVTQQATTTIATPTSLSTQAKPHANSPSQLNVGGDTTMLHQTAFNPLLVGLVSGFVITAVIITLLLFLKLRRRNSRPEFRRLQDLPMDDMEDTPLSMYSY